MRVISLKQKILLSLLNNITKQLTLAQFNSIITSVRPVGHNFYLLFDKAKHCHYHA